MLTLFIMSKTYNHRKLWHVNYLWLDITVQHQHHNRQVMVLSLLFDWCLWELFVFFFHRVQFYAGIPSLSGFESNYPGFKQQTWLFPFLFLESGVWYTIQSRRTGHRYKKHHRGQQSSPQYLEIFQVLKTSFISIEYSLRDWKLSATESYSWDVCEFTIMR